MLILCQIRYDTLLYNLKIQRRTEMSGIKLYRYCNFDHPTLILKEGYLTRLTQSTFLYVISDVSVTPRLLIDI